jgi:hypothetical protein
MMELHSPRLVPLLQQQQQQRGATSCSMARLPQQLQCSRQRQEQLQQQKLWRLQQTQQQPGQRKMTVMTMKIYL